MYIWGTAGSCPYLCFTSFLFFSLYIFMYISFSNHAVVAFGGLEREKRFLRPEVLSLSLTPSLTRVCPCLCSCSRPWSCSKLHTTLESEI